MQKEKNFIPEGAKHKAGKSVQKRTSSKIARWTSRKHFAR